MYKVVLVVFFLLNTILSLQAQSNLQEGIWDAAWSPDGALLAVANPNGQVYIYDISGELLDTFQGHKQRATSVAWSPDGNILASAGYDTFIRFWDVKKGELLHEMDLLVGPVGDIEWQPNGTHLAIAGFDTIQIWDTISYKPITNGVAGNILDLEWSPDGSYFAFGSANAAGIARIDGDQFDVSSFLINGEPTTMRTSSVSWNSDGTQVVSTNEDEGVYIWDARTNELVRTLFRNGETFYDAVFVGEGSKTVIALTAEGNVYTLELRTGEVLKSTQENAFLWSLSWNPTYELLAINGTRQMPNQPSTERINPAVTGFLSLYPVNINTDSEQ